MIERCYNCQCSVGCDQEKMVFCWRYCKMCGVNDCCKEFVPESFASDSDK